ncbi:MAG: FkbM family methyltransferase [Ktedonobacteraceae bacterium]
MKISNPAKKIFLATQKFKNWPEVITSIVKRQETIKLVLRNGVQIEVAENLLWLVNEIFFNHVYNPVNLQIGDNDIVVDIGAHVGAFTLLAASITQNTVYAFEPSPQNFESLKRNIHANGLTKVIAHNSAVSDKVGTTKLILHYKTSVGNTLFEHFSPDKLEKYKTSEGDLAFDPPILGTGKPEKLVEVPTTTLQDIMDRNNIQQLDFLKMDCEGSEGSILHSLPQEYLKRVKKIAMEFHDHLSVFSHDEIQKLLGEAGFITILQWDNQSAFGYLYAWRH